MRFLIIGTIFTIAMLGSMYSLGFDIAMKILAGMYFLLATGFILKKDFHGKYWRFMNPKYQMLLEEKGETFGRKDRKSTIISYYLMSIVMFLNSRMIRFTITETREMLKLSTMVKMGGLFLAISIIIAVVGNNFLKESKTYNEYYAKMIIIGLVLFVLLKAII
ncbi:MAG: hypothetical protein KAH05_08145 [Clostridiales bacterium]|nr:hypothetical protein [Clostridiales bacterium]